MIIIYNPHVDDFIGEPPHFRWLKRRALKKYGFLAKALVEAQGCVPVLIDGTASAFIPARYFGAFPSVVRRAVASIEYFIWRRRNSIPGLRRIRSSEPKLEQHTLLAFSYKSATGAFSLRAPLLRKFGAVVFHLSHYFVSTEEKSANISQLENCWLAGDSDLTNNSYFRDLFPWYNRRFLTLPFSVSERFTVKQRLQERENRCVATGSIHDLREERPASAYASYVEHTGLNTYHPLRRELYDARDRLSGSIDVRVSLFRDYGVRSSAFKRWVRHFEVSQKSHFSYDIVDLYNQFVFAVIGEEAAGFPALGMFEAMACGCVVLADPARLNGLGLVAGREYLPHDGSLQGLLKSLDEASLRNDLERISAAGREAVQLNFSSRAAGSRWVALLRELVPLPQVGG